MPQWVQQGYESYARRFGPDCKLQLREIASARKSKQQSADEVMREDGRRLLAALPAGSHVVALDERGKLLDNRAFVATFRNWLEANRTVALVIGGADGLDPACREAASQRWSLASATYPHALVRIMVAEQLYRAYSVLHNHPYHRA